MLAVAIVASLSTATILDLPPGAVARLGETRFRAGGPVRHLTFSPDGETLLGSLEVSGRLIPVAWDATTGRRVPVPSCLPSVRAVPPVACRAVCLRPGLVLLAGPGKAAGLWDTATEQRVARFAGHSAPVVAVAVSPDRRQFATADTAGVVRVWDGEAFVPRFTPRGHTAAVRSIRVSEDGRRAVTTADDGTARVWDLATGKELRVLPADGPADLTPDGLGLVLGAGRGVVVRDVLTGLAVVQSREPPGPRFTVPEVLARLGVCLAASPDERTLAVPFADGSVGVFERASGGLRLVLAGHGTACRLAVFTPDGTRLLTAGDDHTVLVWDVRPQAVRLAGAWRRETSAARLWATMCTGRADEAFRAMARLAAEPAAAVQTARLRIRPATPDDPDTPEQRLADSRAVELLESLGTVEAREFLEGLVEGGQPSAWRTREAIRAVIRLKRRAGDRPD